MFQIFLSPFKINTIIYISSCTFINNYFCTINFKLKSFTRNRNLCIKFNEWLMCSLYLYCLIKDLTNILILFLNELFQNKKLF